MLVAFGGFPRHGRSCLGGRHRVLGSSARSAGVDLCEHQVVVLHQRTGCDALLELGGPVRPQGRRHTGRDNVLFVGHREQGPGIYEVLPTRGTAAAAGRHYQALTGTGA